MSWTQLRTQHTGGQLATAIDQTTRDLSGLPLATLRNRQALSGEAERRLRSVLRRLGYPLPDGNQLQALHAQVLAKAGGLGFLDALLPPASFAYTDLLVNGDGSVWGRRKGQMRFDPLELHPAPEEVWRAVDALLSPQGRACTEGTTAR